MQPVNPRLQLLGSGGFAPRFPSIPPALVFVYVPSRIPDSTSEMLLGCVYSKLHTNSVHEPHARFGLHELVMPCRSKSETKSKPWPKSGKWNVPSPATRSIGRPCRRLRHECVILRRDARPVLFVRRHHAWSKYSYRQPPKFSGETREGKQTGGNDGSFRKVRSHLSLFSAGKSCCVLGRSPGFEGSCSPFFFPGVSTE